MPKTAAFVRVALLMTVGLALAVAGTAGAEEIPTTDGGHADACTSLVTGVEGVLVELDALLPVDPVREADVLARVQTVLNQYRFEAGRVGC